VLGLGLQAYQVHDVDDLDVQSRQVSAEQVCGGQCFPGGDVARAGEHDVEFVVGRAGPWPAAEPSGAVRDGLIDGEVVQRGLLPATMT
jgi:hypothetical protein